MKHNIKARGNIADPIKRQIRNAMMCNQKILDQKNSLI